MKKITLIIFFLTLLSEGIYGQALDANSTMGLPKVSDLNDITGEAAANIGNIVYNTTDDLVYRYDGTNWVVLENAAEVPLVTDRDVNYDTSIANGTTATTPALADETTVEEVVAAIAPITSKAGRVFFPPSIAIDASVNVNGETLNLYNEYLLQYSLTPPPIGATPVETAISAGAPPTIPVYLNTELYYYVTYADPSVFDNISIDEFGEMTYDIIGQPTDDNAIINVVFVVK